MTNTMQRMDFDVPEETRPFLDGTGQVDLVNVKEGVIGRGTFLPGWKWSEHVAPIAGTLSCEAAHAGYVLSGQMRVTMDGGEELVFGPGDVMIIDPGHDAQVVGDAPCVVLDWQGFGDYARAR